MKLRHGIPSLLTLVVGFLSLGGVASAASFTVNDTTDAALATSTNKSCVSTHGGSCTLRAAVQAADNTGGANTITLPAGTYKLTRAAAGPSTHADPSTGDLDVNGTTLTITGAGSGSTVVDANRIDRAFAVQSGAGLTLSGMTIENGSPSANSTGSQNGGAIYTDGALSLAGDVTLLHNAALDGGESGGGIYADTNGSLSLTGATLTDNSSGGGGAVWLQQSGTTTITDSVFNGNTVPGAYGGAIYANNGPLNVDSSSFTDNYASFDGGAINGDNSSALSVTNSSFESNSAGTGGAVWDNVAVPMTLTGDRFSGNSADLGGAVALNSSTPAEVSLDRDEFDGNTAANQGGAVYNSQGSFSSSGSSFVGNSANSEGGALWVGAGSSFSLSLVNSTVSGNQADLGGGIYYNAGEPSTLTNDTIAYNSASVGAGGGVDGTHDVLTGAGATGVLNTILAENHGGDCDANFAGPDAGHNLDSDSSCFNLASDKPGVDPLLGHPADNGGPVLTDAELPGSPAIDAGTDTGCPATDARGVTRPQGTSCDIGAFELDAARLSVSKSAPSSATVGNPFDYTVTVTDDGPGPSTGTTVVDLPPANTRLFGVTASQGSCTPSSSPAKLTCQLGSINAGASATITMVVAVQKTGTVTNTATATNDQASSAHASATTKINPATPVGIKPKATSGGHQVLGTNRVRIFGYINPGNQTTAYFFQLGTGRSYGQITTVGHTARRGYIAAVLSRLRRGVWYHYRLVTINASGISYGRDRTFRLPRRR